MMFAHGGDVDVPDNDHFIVLLSRQRNDMLARILAHAGSQLYEHLGHSPRCLLQPRAIRILANAFEYQTHAARDAREIYRAGGWFTFCRCCAHFPMTGPPYREVVTSYSPGLSRFAATLGKDHQSNQPRMGLCPQIRRQRGVTTPFGVAVFIVCFPG